MPDAMKGVPKTIVLMMMIMIFFSLSAGATNLDIEGDGNIAEPDETIKVETLKQILESQDEAKEEKPSCFRFFNKRHQLVYQCMGADDERLAEFLRRSDIMWKTHSSSYYLLGD